MNIHEQLKEAMDGMERRLTFMKKVNKHWNIPMSSLFDHLNNKTKSMKIGPLDVLTKEDATIVAWILNMQKHGLFIDHCSNLGSRWENSLKANPHHLKMI